MHISQVTPEGMAEYFHEAYERKAHQFGYQTRPESAKPWSEVPNKNKLLMVAVCQEFLEEINNEY